VAINFIQSSVLPTRWGIFQLHGFFDDTEKKEHVALTLGSVSTHKPVLTRVHSECLTGDSLFSLRCDCGSQLEEAMRLIAKEGIGVIVYLRQEGRGIGLLNKIKAYHLQDKGADTVEANEQLGFDPDVRDYSICGYIFNHLGISDVRLLTNNPKKVQALKDMGVTVSERLSIQTGENSHNEAYLAVKARKLGHLFEEK
jgi:GTP cyclohydrolase II